MIKIKGYVSLFTMLAAFTVPCMSFAGAIPTTADVEAKFSKILKNTKVASVKESPVPGIYEIISGPNVFYFAPAGDGHLIFGQIVDRDGKNLTAAIQSGLKASFDKEKEKGNVAKLQKLDFSQAVKIGNGPNVVIEFTDPDCPFCRKADKILQQYSADVTRYVFLFPLEQLHPQAKAKAIMIHSNKDKAATLHDVFAGKYDRGLPPCETDPTKLAIATKLVEGSVQAGNDLGVQGTPMLYINGNMVNGADEQRIVSLLKKQP